MNDTCRREKLEKSGRFSIALEGVLNDQVPFTLHRGFADSVCLIILRATGSGANVGSSYSRQS
jgi:hypothetical protein